VWYLDTRNASHDEIKNFEYKLLGEVRMLGAVRKHRSIVDIYGHQFSSKWVQDDGGKEYRMLQSVILMEYVNGGSLKVKSFVVFVTLMYYFSTIVVMFFFNN
jgi:serine/threonine protein kinase